MFRGPRFRNSYSITNSRNLHFPNQKRQGRTPVCAPLCRDTRDGMVRWNVKPGILAIDHENILFRGFVIPAHLARAPEIGFAGLQSGQLAVLRIALQEGSLETSGAPVPRL